MVIVTCELIKGLMFCIDFSQLKVLLDQHKVNFHKTSFMDVISIHTSKERDDSYVHMYQLLSLLAIGF